MAPHDDSISPPRAQRGRKSAASLSMVPDVRLRRPAPPEGLTPPEKALWQEICGSVRPDGFCGASEYLLEPYVRMLCQCRDIAACIVQEEVASERRIELVSLHRALVMSVASIAVKLRLTVRATHDRYTPRAVSTAGKRPWEDVDSEPEPAA